MKYFSHNIQEYFHHKTEFQRERHTSKNLHKGHCGACSVLQDLGVYMAQNLTQDTRRCGLEGVFLGKWMCTVEIYTPILVFFRKE